MAEQLELLADIRFGDVQADEFPSKIEYLAGGPRLGLGRIWAH